MCRPKKKLAQGRSSQRQNGRPCKSGPLDESRLSLKGAAAIGVTGFLHFGRTQYMWPRGAIGTLESPPGPSPQDPREKKSYVPGAAGQSPFTQNSQDANGQTQSSGSIVNSAATGRSIRFNS